MIQVTPGIAIDENEIHQEFIQASGQGGQNVNLAKELKSRVRAARPIWRVTSTVFVWQGSVKQ